MCYTTYSRYRSYLCICGLVIFLSCLPLAVILISSLCTLQYSLIGFRLIYAHADQLSGNSKPFLFILREKKLKLNAPKYDFGWNPNIFVS